VAIRSWPRYRPVGGGMRHRSCRPPWLRPRTTTVEAADLLARSRMRDLDNQDRQCLDTQYRARFARSSGRQGHTSETNQVGSGHKLLGPRRWMREINRSQTESSSAAWLRWIGLGGSSCRAGPARHIADASPYHIADASTPYRGRFRQHASRRGRFYGTYPGLFMRRGMWARKAGVVLRRRRP
jgi:hypothetical protein